MKKWTERALGLPDNSVKAIALFSVLGAVIYLEVIGTPASETLKSLVAMAMGFYFGKGSQKENKEN
jgi:hypothetical protein